MYGIYNVYLENGLNVVMHKLSGSRVFACGIWIKQGSKHEDSHTNGLSHLLEHLLLNTSNDDEESRNLKRLLDEIASSGVIYNATTCKEYTFYYFTGLSRYLYKCLNALYTIVKRKPNYSSDVFNMEKQVVEREAVSYYSSFNQIVERSSQALWGSSDIGNIIVGSLDVIRQAEVEDIIKIHSQRYTPENASLVIIGDVDFNKSADMIQDCFGEWEDVKSVEVKEKYNNNTGIYFNSVTGSKNSVLSLCFRTPSFSTKSRNSMEVISKILGDSSLESILAQEIRVKRGLAYSINAFNNFYEKRGSMGFTAVCGHDKVNEIVEIMMHEIKKIRDNGVKSLDLVRAKNKLITQRLLELESVISHLKFLGICATHQFVFSLEQEIRNIQNLNEIAIQETMKDVFINENVGFAAIGDFNIDSVVELINI